MCEALPEEASGTTIPSCQRHDFPEDIEDTGTSTDHADATRNNPGLGIMTKAMMRQWQVVIPSPRLVPALPPMMALSPPGWTRSFRIGAGAPRGWRSPLPPLPFAALDPDLQMLPVASEERQTAHFVHAACENAQALDRLAAPQDRPADRFHHRSCSVPVSRETPAGGSRATLLAGRHPEHRSHKLDMPGNIPTGHGPRPPCRTNCCG